MGTDPYWFQDDKGCDTRHFRTKFHPSLRMTKKSRPRTEIELKLSMSPEAMARLRRSSALRDCASSPLVRKKLLSVYIRHAKNTICSLPEFLFRVRRTGKQHIRTIKIGTAIEAGLSQPREHEQAVARIDPALDSIDDDELRDVLMRRIDGQTVAPGIRNGHHSLELQPGSPRCVRHRTRPRQWRRDRR